MSKKLPVYKVVAIAKAIDELHWWGDKTKWPKKMIKRLRKELRKGA